MGIMILAIINGLITSIVLETFILIRQNFSFIEAIKTASGMSLISMLSMEIMMNLTDYLIYRRRHFNMVACAHYVDCRFFNSMAI